MPKLTQLTFVVRSSKLVDTNAIVPTWWIRDQLEARPTGSPGTMHSLELVKIMIVTDNHYTLTSAEIEGLASLANTLADKSRFPQIDRVEVVPTTYH